MNQTEFDELLIHYVEQYEYIFDKKHKSYRDEKKKENAWSTIGKHLKCDGKY